MLGLALATLAWAASAACTGRPESPAVWSPGYTFEDYVRHFCRSYPEDEVEQRRRTVESNLRRIEEHNAWAGRRWTAGVNEFLDRSSQEMRRLMGFDKTRGFSAASHLETPLPARGPLPDRVDWRERGVVTKVKDQSSCGGCWAFSAAETVESFLALSGGPLVELSPEEFISCMPNPERCGGRGGCAGATFEQAFNFSQVHGVVTESSFPFQRGPFRRRCDMARLASPVAAVGGYVRLHRNDANALMSAVALHGPVSVVAAALPWQLYTGGIFDGALGMGCGTDIDHAVQLVGYGTDNGTAYWLVRNSWGPRFGEDGYIRILRQPGGEPCGEDTSPLDGVCGTSGWCKCPDKVQVCGMCGILADSSYPTGVKHVAASAAVVV